MPNHNNKLVIYYKIGELMKIVSHSLINDLVLT